MPFFIVYIDESGDTGLNKIRPKDANGASEWLTLGASLYHCEDEIKTVEFIRDVRKRINDTQGPDLHFRRLSDPKKLFACQQLSLQPARAFAVLSHKPNMKGYRNQAAERLFISPRGWFYNWCIRLLLERVTDYAERYMLRHFKETRPIKLVFSERGGVAYDWLKDYVEILMIQSRTQTLHLEKRDVKHSVLDLDLIEVVPHVKSAGCQIADIVTSALHSAADAFGPRWNIEPAKALRPILPTEGGWHHDYSVTLQPSFFKTTRLTSNQKLLFEEYGYCFRLIE